MTRANGRGGRTADGLPHARKRFGQHFLHDISVLDAIVSALGPLEGRTVVEIGPGRGVLTDLLAERAGRLIAIELDRDLAAHLRRRYEGRDNVQIVEADVLQVSLGDLAGSDFVLAGNVPYYITTPILFHALEAPRPEVAVYLVQREVAERMAAPPGDRIYGALSVNLQALSHVEFVRHVPPGAFSPPPKVDSAVVRVRPREVRVVPPSLERRFRGVVTASFGLRRKQMLRVVRTIASLDASGAEGVLKAAGIAPDVRPETLSPADFARLVVALDAVAS